MKKSSRDYRKNKRKKWVRINSIKTITSLSIAMGISRIAVINSSIGMSVVEKALASALVTIETSKSISKITNS